MALLGGWLSSAGREQRAVLTALEELSLQKSPVRVEAEGTGASFFTVLSLRKNGVLLARPRALRGGIAKNGFLRITLPNRGRKQVRVPVVVPLLKLPMSLKYACITGIPEQWTGECKRGADRFNTRRFRNLHLTLPALEKSFRLLDISVSGARVYVGRNAGMTLFEIGAEIGPARLRVAERVRIELDSLVPRATIGDTVGVQWTVARDGKSGKFLLNLLNRLQEQELRQLRIDQT